MPLSVTVRLEPLPNARSQAIANSPIKAGSTIITVNAFATVLLPSQKGFRCDECFQSFSETRPLRRCQGCASYWYCSTACQTSQWNAHHRRMCKVYNSFTTSGEYQALESHQKMDAILLAHFISSLKSPVTPDPGNTQANDEVVFHDLLQGPDLGFLPPIPKFKTTVSNQEVRDIYLRFGNNNFTIHSHFNSVGHGVFPLASRLFNHSCLPNAAAKYHFTPSAPVQMEIIALRDILADEQVCIPYVDPALTKTREKIFELTYGFKCGCNSCIWLRDLGTIPPPPKTPKDIQSIYRLLREHTHVDETISSGSLTQSGPPGDVPRELVCVFDELFMTALSESFSNTSHDGPYDTALETGITLTALYLLIYPRNYPQIGLHLLEIAKVAWNMLVSESAEHINEVKLKSKAKSLLLLAGNILQVLGPEGDEGGPLEEVKVLESLLKAE